MYSAWRRGVVLIALGCASCGGGAAHPQAAPTPTSLDSDTPAPRVEMWRAPSHPMQLARRAGLKPDTTEHLGFHAHAHLDVFVDGKAVVVPGGIGIAIDDPGVHEFPGPLGTGYGGIQPPGCEHACISPLHTHDPDGVLHTESPRRQSNHLGQFFTEWGVVLSKNCIGDYCEPDTTIAVYVDGDPYDGDPAAIKLVDQREIALVIGTPPEEIPYAYDFSNA